MGGRVPGIICTLKDVARNFLFRFLGIGGFGVRLNLLPGQAIALRDLVRGLGELLDRGDLIQFGAIPAAPMDTPLVVADVSRLPSELGWAPEWILTRGLRTTIDWWRARTPALAQEHS